MTLIRNLLAIVPVLFILTACQGTGVAQLAEEARTFTVDANYQRVYKRYMAWLGACGMRGWEVVPTLYPDLGEARIEVFNITTALMLIDIKRDGEGARVTLGLGLWGADNAMYAYHEKTARTDEISDCP